MVDRVTCRFIDWSIKLFSIGSGENGWGTKTSNGERSGKRTEERGGELGKHIHHHYRL